MRAPKVPKTTSLSLHPVKAKKANETITLCLEKGGGESGLQGLFLVILLN